MIVATAGTAISGQRHRALKESRSMIDTELDQNTGLNKGCQGRVNGGCAEMIAVGEKRFLKVGSREVSFETYGRCEYGFALHSPPQTVVVYEVVPKLGSFLQCSYLTHCATKLVKFPKRDEK